MSPPTARCPRAGAAERSTSTSHLAHATAPVSTVVNTVHSSTLRRNDESWVEVASQPSSSPSSIADEIIITGLRVGSSTTIPNGGVVPQRRRRLLQQVDAAAGVSPTAANLAAISSAVPSSFLRSSAGSSQDEYDETESEEDQVMTSSTENTNSVASTPYSFSGLTQMTSAHHRGTASNGNDEDDDDDDEGTALGMPTSGPPTFRPKPNAFTHPPTHLHQLHQQNQNQQQHSSLPTPPHPLFVSPSSRSMSQHSQQRPSRVPGAPHFLLPSYDEDNDEALRASLTTLLSCAAAARGLSKRVGATYSEPSCTAPGVRPGNQPLGLRLAAESELMTETSVPPHPHGQASFRPLEVSQQQQQQRAPPRTSPPSSKPTVSSYQSSCDSNVSTGPTSSKTKRTATAAPSGNTNRSVRATKKKRTAVATADGEATATYISPTLLTWVVSAGVVVLVSVVGFGAGFVIGREVGRQEAMAAVSSGSSFGGSGGATANATSGGHDVMSFSTGNTLRRFRWGAGMTRSVAA